MLGQLHRALVGRAFTLHVHEPAGKLDVADIDRDELGASQTEIPRQADRARVAGAARLEARGPRRKLVHQAADVPRHDVVKARRRRIDARHAQRPHDPAGLLRTRAEGAQRRKPAIDRRRAELVARHLLAVVPGHGVRGGRVEVQKAIERVKAAAALGLEEKREAHQIARVGAARFFVHAGHGRFDVVAILGGQLYR